MADINGIDNIIAKLTVMEATLHELKTMPQRMSVVAYDTIISNEAMPDYTGTYRDAIEGPLLSPDGDHFWMGMTIPGLIASAARHPITAEDAESGEDLGAVFTPEQYAFGQAVPEHADPGEWQLEPGSQPYPLRLEAIGSPSAKSGQGIWERGFMRCMEFYMSEMARLGRELGVR